MPLHSIAGQTHRAFRALVTATRLPPRACRVYLAVHPSRYPSLSLLACVFTPAWIASLRDILDTLFSCEAISHASAQRLESGARATLHRSLRWIGTGHAPARRGNCSKGRNDMFPHKGVQIVLKTVHIPQFYPVSSSQQAHKMPQIALEPPGVLVDTPLTLPTLGHHPHLSDPVAAP